MNDKIPAAITILVGTGVLSILAGFNNQLGKFLLVFMVIIAMAWLIGGGTQGHLAKWTSLMTGSTGSTQVV
jgi:hypothetical protein